MPGENFSAQVTASHRGSVISLLGTVNRDAKEGLEAAYIDASQTAGEIVLDFSDVEYINSTGIAVIVSILARARAEGRDIAAIGLSSHYLEVFRITRLSDFMHIYEDTTAGA